MNINDLIGKPSAVVIGPCDVVAITIDRYLTGQQLAEIGSYYQKRLPNTKVILLQKGASVEVFKLAPTETLVVKAAVDVPKFG